MIVDLIHLQLFASIKDQLKNYDRGIGILINNAGVMLESPNRFMEQSEDVIWQHVNVNIASVLMMTRAVLPGMISRRRGLIINMSSIAGYQPLPLMGVYSASKVSLRLEWCLSCLCLLCNWLHLIQWFLILISEIRWVLQQNSRVRVYQESQYTCTDCDTIIHQHQDDQME